jgi:peptidoglycan/LPS O-acetylase OafA/YrhL
MQTHDGVPNFMVISAFVLCFILHALSVGNHVIILYVQQIVMLLTKIWPCLQFVTLMPQGICVII